jgi:hypothetical protein
MHISFSNGCSAIHNAFSVSGFPKGGVNTSKIAIASFHFSLFLITTWWCGCKCIFRGVQFKVHILSTFIYFAIRFACPGGEHFFCYVMHLNSAKNICMPFCITGFMSTSQRCQECYPKKEAKVNYSFSVSMYLKLTMYNHPRYFHVIVVSPNAWNMSRIHGSTC